MYKSFNYKGFTISYENFTGTTTVNCGFTELAVFYGLGEIIGEIKAKNYIDLLNDN